jgi:hypothetical protein
MWFEVYTAWNTLFKSCHKHPILVERLKVTYHEKWV